jgi:oxygen-independent coproporphyrinogen-3 oxidase
MGMNSKNPGLYLHIPFCLTKCSYCSFYSQTDVSLIPDFIEALGKEMEMAGVGFSSSFDTVYIGGGTPSVLSPRQIEKILAGIEKSFRLSRETEFTLEANPGDLDLSLLRSLKNLGINRLNLGVQSFDPQTLAFLGRRHTAEEAIKSVDAAREAGFDYIGLDLIYGVPGQPLGLWRDTLSQAVAFCPEHLSCYQLTLEDETPLAEGYRRGGFSPPGEDELLQFFLTTSEMLENSGFIHYEVSNFARGLKHASRHNQKYWNHTPYLGLGPSAHSFSGSARWWNSRSLNDYLQALQSGNLPIEGKEILTREQLRMEAWFLALRTRKGVHIEEFNAQYGEDFLSCNSGILKTMQEQGHLVLEAGYLRPTRTGLALADSLARI